MTRNMRKMTVLMLAGLLAATPVLAEDMPKDMPPPSGEERPHDGPPPNGEDRPNNEAMREDMKKQMEERFMKGDTDKDGFLSKEEMQAEQEKRFNEMFSSSDKDSDGRLSRDEMREGHKAMREKFKKRMEDRRGNDGDRGGREKFRERMEDRRSGSDGE